MAHGDGFHGGKPLLAVEREDRVLRVRLDTPASGNALTEAVLDELLDVLDAVRDTPRLRALVLSGAGADFCLGGDRAEFEQLLTEDPGGNTLRTLHTKARQVCEGLATSPVVTIARLHGKVIGAGLALALFCDLRAGADTAVFRLPELALGVPMAWGGALPRLLQEAGAARIRELILTGESFDAAAAQRMGVLHKAVPEERLDDAVTAWIRPLLRRSPTALRVTKAALNAYAAPARLGDATLLDGELMAAVLLAGRAAPAGHNGLDG